MVTKINFYTRFNRPPQVDTELDFDTCHISQSEADMCTLQNQLRRYGEDGLAAKMQMLQDKFGYADCTKIGNFADLQNRVRQGTEYFEALPSEVRARFGHRPENFYDFIEKNPEAASKEGFTAPINVDSEVVKNTVDTGLSSDANSVLSNSNDTLSDNVTDTVAGKTP